MDWLSLKEQGLGSIKKYRIAALILLVGIFLMALPSKNTHTPPVLQKVEPEEERLEDSLGLILSNLSGAGKVEVLLTEAVGSQTVFQMDEDRSTGETTTDIRKKTILISNSSREETGLIQRIDPPVYQGAVILAQGADNPKVKLSLVEAVSNATGLSTDKISVLKMK